MRAWKVIRIGISVEFAAFGSIVPAKERPPQVCAAGVLYWPSISVQVAGTTTGNGGGTSTHFGLEGFMQPMTAAIPAAVVKCVTSHSPSPSVAKA
jgi:hypothetical protein